MQDRFIPTKKELSISEFKEKFGSDRYPKAYFKLELWKIKNQLFK